MAQRRQRGPDLGDLGGAGRPPCRRTGSRRPRPGPSARSAASGRPRERVPNSGAQRGEDRAEAGRGEHEHVRLGDVRRVRGHPVARPTPSRRSPARTRRTCVAQLGGGQGDRRPGLRVGEHDRVVVGDARHPQHVLGVVERGAGEPPRARHDGVGEDLGRRRVGEDLEVVPDRAPEPGQVGHRPAPQRVVVGEAQPTGTAEPAHESRRRASAPGRRPAGSRARRRGPRCLGSWWRLPPAPGGDRGAGPILPARTGRTHVGAPHNGGAGWGAQPTSAVRGRSRPERARYRALDSDG